MNLEEIKKELQGLSKEQIEEILQAELDRIGVSEDGDFDKYGCVAAAVSIYFDDEDDLTTVRLSDECGGDWTGPTELALCGLRSIPAGDGYEWPAFWDVFRIDGEVQEAPTEPYEVYLSIGKISTGE